MASQALLLHHYKLLTQSLAGLIAFYWWLGLLGEASLCCEVIVQQTQQHLAQGDSPDQPDELTCLQGRCHDMLTAIHHEIDQTLQAASQLAGQDRSSTSALANGYAEMNLLAVPLPALPTLAQPETRLPPVTDERLALLPTYEPVTGIAHSRD